MMYCDMKSCLPGYTLSVDVNFFMNKYLCNVITIFFGCIMQKCFIESIANIGYDNSYGAPEIAVDLVIVGDNWWLTRGEYDGSEWWDFHTIPILPAGQRVSPFNKIKVVSSKSEIAELNSQKDKGWQ